MQHVRMSIYDIAEHTGINSGILHTCGLASSGRALASHMCGGRRCTEWAVDVDVVSVGAYAATLYWVAGRARKAAA